MIIDELGAEPISAAARRSATLRPDSVFCRSPRMSRASASTGFIALCKALAPTLHAMKVGRVIARPFVGSPGSFTRTGHRRDFAVAPPAPTLLDKVQAAGRDTHAVGKIGDIFSMRGIGDLRKGPDAELMGHLATLAAAAALPWLAHLRQFRRFRQLYGHRRDVSGYARALEWFDADCRASLTVSAARRPDPVHRRPRLRPDLDRHRPHEGANPHSRHHARTSGRVDGPARQLRRHAAR